MIQHSAANKVEVHFHCVISYHHVCPCAKMIDIAVKEDMKIKWNDKFLQRINKILVMYHDFRTPSGKVWLQACMA